MPPLFFKNAFLISAPGGRPMQISVYRSQNGVWRGGQYPYGRHFVSNIHSSTWLCHNMRFIWKWSIVLVYIPVDLYGNRKEAHMSTLSYSIYLNFKSCALLLRILRTKSIQSNVKIILIKVVRYKIVYYL